MQRLPFRAVRVKQTVSKYTNDRQDWLRIMTICYEAQGGANFSRW